MKRMVAVGLCVGMLSGCATDGSMTKQDIGTGAGVVLGGIAGSFLGKGSGRIVGAVAGAALGGFIGNQIGKMLDEEDQKELQEQAKQALVNQPDNTPVNWSSDRSDATAVVTAENSRVETRQVKVVRDASVAPAGQLDLIGAKYVAKTSANVRLAPSKDADLATTLPAGSTIWAVGKVQDKPWIMVAKNGKSIGYVAASSLSPAPASTVASTQTASTQKAAFDLDASAPVRTPADLDALEASEKADVVTASVTCRDIKTVASSKGETATSTQTACKSPDGSWNL